MDTSQWNTMHQSDVLYRGCLWLKQGICLSDPRERSEKICGIRLGPRKPQCLLGLSLSLHPMEARCPEWVWESSGAPQHVPEW